MADETRQLAEFTANFKYEHIPSQVRQWALDVLVDQIGCEIGCSDLPWTRQVRDTYRRSGGAPEAETAPEEAALCRTGPEPPTTAAAAPSVKMAMLSRSASFMGLCRLAPMRLLTSP